MCQFLGKLHYDMLQLEVLQHLALACVARSSAETYSLEKVYGYFIAL